ncbi:SDR family NAD(P)-dependent oxidoreductase [Halolamina sp. CBA1230]|uniref:SDR family NAD(P)-dependent oxidoreductase n=1 Tax=Halolamina sp. CBA1230 TaxID=1853690 RepID=UPI0009A24FF9|nr:SDR family NAD(P)-dependent oxidoreductase [Halolamina sp. CBA1230]QKY20901.1 SDR family NAD(P)-dependent oxidoreductase [Halolamina sp. CBA1230]
MEHTTVVVTGAGGAIGGALVEAFADEGATVFAGVHEEGGRFADADRVETMRVDARDEFDVEYLMEDAARTGEIDLVVPCAAVFHGDPGEQRLADEGYAAFDDEYRTNARGVFVAVKEALPHLADDARVLVPSGSVAQEAKPGYGGYAVSKAAAEAVARQFAAEIEPAVGVVDPGGVASDLTGGQGRDPADVVGLFRWAATSVDAEDLDGERLGLSDWKQATR